MYECAICQHINHSSRLHCSACGTVPAMYSPNGLTIRGEEHITSFPWPKQTVAAHGCERANKQMNVHVKLRTMPLEYYAD